MLIGKKKKIFKAIFAADGDGRAGPEPQPWREAMASCATGAAKEKAPGKSSGPFLLMAPRL
jgi:hypothetical protein